MPRIKAKYRKSVGMFEPAIPVDLPDGKDAEVIVPAEEAGERPLEGAPEENIWAGYDPEKVKTALHKLAGTLTLEEAERRIAEIYRAREEGTRPLTRP